MMTALAFSALVVLGGHTQTGAPRWTVQISRLPVDVWASHVGNGQVMVSAAGDSDVDTLLAGQFKRAVSAALGARRIHVVTVPVGAATAEQTLEQARRLGCSHVLGAAVVDEGGETPVVDFSLQTVAGGTLHRARVTNALVEAPPLAIFPILSEEKLKRDAATLAFPRYAAHVSFMTISRNGVVVAYELTLRDASITVMGVPSARKTGPLCALATVPDDAVEEVCERNQLARAYWNAGDQMPVRAEQLLVLAEAYNARVADILGADTVEFDEEYFPVREVRAQHETRDRNASRRRRTRRPSDGE